jgi:Tfp pilus assembly protein PilV
MKLSPGQSLNPRAFTILEVMIALSIFFMCVFAILGLVTRSLNQARNLQPFEIDPLSAIAELTLTNRFEEGPIPPEVIQHFEEEHPGYTVGGTITEVATNGLFQVDLLVGGLSETKHVVTSQSSILIWRPLSGQGARIPGVRR